MRISPAHQAPASAKKARDFWDGHAALSSPSRERQERWQLHRPRNKSRLDGRPLDSSCAGVETAQLVVAAWRKRAGQRLASVEVAQIDRLRGLIRDAEFATQCFGNQGP